MTSSSEEVYTQPQPPMPSIQDGEDNNRDPNNRNSIDRNRNSTDQYPPMPIHKNVSLDNSGQVLSSPDLSPDAVPVPREISQQGQHAEDQLLPQQPRISIKSSKPKILLLGSRRSGKTSIQRYVLFLFMYLGNFKDNENTYTFFFFL